jgi:hypothetical protein
MNSEGLEMGGLTNSASFASADFPDANETSLYDYSIAFETNYSNAINNAVFKHYNEIKEKQVSATESLTAIWKRRYREFLMTKNKKLLDFLSMKLKSHPVLGAAENFIQIFGKKDLNVNQQMIRDIVFDISSNSISDEYDALCISKELLPIEKYIEQTKFFMDEYKLSGEKILDKQDLITRKLDSVDLIQAKLNGLLVSSENEHYNELMEVSQKYLSKIYDDNLIEDEYNDLMAEYKKFLYLRDIIKTIRTTDISDKEPLCSICFNDSIQHAFVPCGHTFCVTCVKRQTSICAICRTNIRDRVKLYFT